MRDLKTKCVVVGDSGCGKSCLIETYKGRGKFPSEHVPTVVDNFCPAFQLGMSTGRTIQCYFNIWDTNADAKLDRLRFPFILPFLNTCA